MLKFNPNCSIKHYCDNVKKPEFGVGFVSKFDIVMNALDNLDARRHVNRLCLAADKPLIESGTTGYLGQVSVHLPRQTECFECTEKPTPKSYPICTVRSTPDKPIHLVVWGKMLYEAFFATEDDSNPLNDLAKEMRGAGAAEGGGGAAAAAPAEDPPLDEERVGWAAQVFAKSFKSETERLLTLEDLWVNDDGSVKRRKPVPLDVAGSLGLASADALKLDAFAELEELDDQAQPTVRQSTLLFLRAAARLRGATDRPFDKDDPMANDFVTAAVSNHHPLSPAVHGAFGLTRSFLRVPRATCAARCSTWRR